MELLTVLCIIFFIIAVISLIGWELALKLVREALDAWWESEKKWAEIYDELMQEHCDLIAMVVEEKQEDD